MKAYIAFAIAAFAMGPAFAGDKHHHDEASPEALDRFQDKVDALNAKLADPDLTEGRRDRIEELIEKFEAKIGPVEPPPPPDPPTPVRWDFTATNTGGVYGSGGKTFATPSNPFELEIVVRGYDALGNAINLTGVSSGTGAANQSGMGLVNNPTEPGFVGHGSAIEIDVSGLAALNPQDDMLITVYQTAGSWEVYGNNAIGQVGGTLLGSMSATATQISTMNVGPIGAYDFYNIVAVDDAGLILQGVTVLDVGGAGGVPAF